jgi:hypothetical protein
MLVEAFGRMTVVDEGRDTWREHAQALRRRWDAQDASERRARAIERHRRS